MRANQSFLPLFLFNLVLAIGAVGVYGNVSRADPVPVDPLDPIELGFKYTESGDCAVEVTYVLGLIPWYACTGTECVSPKVCRRMPREAYKGGPFIGYFCDCVLVRVPVLDPIPD